MAGYDITKIVDGTFSNVNKNWNEHVQTISHVKYFACLY